MKALKPYDTPEKKYVKYFLEAWIVMVGFYVAVIPFALVEMVADFPVDFPLVFWHCVYLLFMVSYAVFWLSGLLMLVMPLRYLFGCRWRSLATAYSAAFKSAVFVFLVTLTVWFTGCVSWISMGNGEAEYQQRVNGVKVRTIFGLPYETDDGDTGDDT